MVTGSFLIGNAKIYIEGPDKLKYPQNLERFRINESVDEKKLFYTCRYRIHMEDNFTTLFAQLKAQQIGPVSTREDLTVFQTKTGECRLMNFRGANWYYAASLQTGPDQCEIWFLRQVQDKLLLDTVFWAPFCLERLLIERGGMVLHSSYIERDGQAILFSAPSGTGKSTQASLWEKFRNTRTINGDRTLLMRRGKEWFAYGWPICGSSEICLNESFPIRAVVMLCQAKKNQIYRLKGFDAFQKVWSQLMINGWNRSFQEMAMDLLGEFLEGVCVFELACDISEQAVECLEDGLNESEK